MSRMSTFMKSKSLASSANFSPASSKLKSSLKSSIKNEAKKVLNSSTLENIEIEYIKNLQQQVYFLEMECNYLRQQLNLNGLQTQSKYEQKSQGLRNEMENLDSERKGLEKSLLIETLEKENTQSILEQTQKNYILERDLLKKEIDQLKIEKNQVQGALLNKSIELDSTKQNLNLHHMDFNQSIKHLNENESIVENVRKDNMDLRVEINEARNQLISRDIRIKELQQQLADPTRNFIVSNELKARNENEILKLDLNTFKTKMAQMNEDKIKLSKSLEKSLKQNEDDLILAKKNLDLAKLNVSKLTNELENKDSIIVNYKTQVEQYKMQDKLETKNQAALKKRIHDLELSLTRQSSSEIIVENLKKDFLLKQHEFDTEKKLLIDENIRLISKFRTFESKIVELNLVIDKMKNLQDFKIEDNKTKEAFLNSKLDESEFNLRNEKNTNSNLQLNITNLQRQEEIYSNLSKSLKDRISELELQLEEKTTEVLDFKNKYYYNSQEQIDTLREDKEKLLAQIALLEGKLNDIDRIKKMENLVQSQKWNELGQLADSMKNLSNTMEVTGSLWGSETNNFIDETLKQSLKL